MASSHSCFLSKVAEQLLAIADYGPTFGFAALSISRACSSQEWGHRLITCDYRRRIVSHFGPSFQCYFFYLERLQPIETRTGPFPHTVPIIIYWKQPVLSPEIYVALSEQLATKPDLCNNPTYGRI